MPLLKRVPAIAALVFLIASAQARSAPQTPPLPVGQLDADNPLVGRIFDGRTGAEVPLAEALDRARRTEVVLLGERHDNPDHHALQAYILGELLDAGGHPALIFEMIDGDQKETLDSWRATPTPDIGELNDLLSWERRGWPSFSWYEPLFALALEQSLPILPGNPPDAQVHAIARGQDPDTIAALGLEAPLPAPLDSNLLETLRDSHCGMVPEQALAPIALAQRAKDATMARAVITALTERAESAVIITGSEHARTDRGAPFYLPVGLSHLSIAFTEAFVGEMDPLSYGEAKVVTENMPPHDLLWFTPRIDRDDPCAGLAEHFQGHENGASEH
ncbi:MAG: ChaN family lipoprotein [Rhodospirillum sp.]|nr:ChaN family lipoprotein [Rhodospirillum sp.]MCF8487841.1 ChaN family lipoprotein [Rhodospirillum sp.]MCF8502633.1 ChaN family lipoprotein [Rhodospirillum sp.]